MRLAFSTLGCSGLPLSEVVALAQQTGWTGIEVRAANDEPVHIGLNPAQRAQARADLAGVTPICIASYVRVAAEGSDDACVADALAHARLAADLGISAVRVFAGAPVPGRDADDAAVRRLAEIAAGLPAGVAVWLETHDSHPRGADIARVLRRVGDRRVRAIWDVLHPWRCGEAPGETMEALRAHLAHVQVKDVASATERTPLPLGTGSVPLAAALNLLASDGYSGWLGLEWESKWHPGAVPLPEALHASLRWLRTRGGPALRRITAAGPSG
ncbi:sugar phosphate isomerase/epimerase family protein [Micromonospora sp. LZ34]